MAVTRPWRKPHPVPAVSAAASAVDAEDPADLAEDLAAGVEASAAEADAAARVVDLEVPVAGAVLVDSPDAEIFLLRPATDRDAPDKLAA